MTVASQSPHRHNRNLMKRLVVWFDVPVLDLDRAIAFYTAVLGEEVLKQEMGPGFVMGLLPGEEEVFGGCLYVSDETKPTDQGTMQYFNVNGRLRAAVEAAKANGGVVRSDVEQIGPWGYRAIVLDSEGNRIALHSQTDS
jgi:predicted enzyme related to lactoylglutathione lyase